MTSADPVALLEEGLATTRRIVAAVRTEQYADATPCTQWTVRDLINHMVGGTQMFAAVVAGSEPPPFDPFGMPPDVIGDDAVATYDAAIDAALDAWRTKDLSGTVALPSGEMPAENALGIHFCDNLVHGWDLARATGQDDGISPELGEAAHEMLHGNVSPERRGVIFAEEQPAPADAPAIDRLVAYLGRPLG